MKGLNKAVKNQVSIPKDKPCLQVLGNTAAVTAFSRFYENNAEALTVLAASKLLKFSSESIYDHKEFAAYKQAIGEMSSFFVDCWREIDSEKKTLQVNE